VDRFLVVFFGGGLGAVARYFVGAQVMTRYAGRFPLGTFLINITGSFLIGAIMTGFSVRTGAHPNWRLFLVTGILGGYTTFSSFEYESYVATKAGTPLIALLYVVSSVGFGYLAVWIGAWLFLKR
jgi:fluoride exporter